MDEPFAILGVSPNASAGEIEAAYRRERAGVIARGQTEDEEAALTALDHAFAEACRRSAEQSLPAVMTSSVVVSTLNPLANMNSTSMAVGGRICSYCGSSNPPQATRCQNCFEMLTQKCPNCGHPLELTQTVCDRCQTVVTEYRQNTAVAPAIEAERIDKERSEGAEYAQEVGIVVDAEQRARIRFWVLVIAFSVLILLVMMSVASSSGSVWR